MPLCGRPARRDSDLCHAHQKPLERGKPLDTPIAKRQLHPKRALHEAALAYADVSSEDDEAWIWAQRRLRQAAIHFAKLLLKRRRERRRERRSASCREGSQSRETPNR